jgi:hypothetical protein
LCFYRPPNTNLHPNTHIYTRKKKKKKKKKKHKKSIRQRVGKSACRAYQREFLGSIQRWNDARATSVSVDGSKAAVEWHFDLTFYGGKRVVRRQVAISTWSRGKITHEVFYHA